MLQPMLSVKSMMLTPQEAMDLLDLCVISQAETDPDKQHIIGRLTAFVRHCILEERTAYYETAHA